MVGGFSGTPLAATTDLSRRGGGALEGLRVDFFLSSGRFLLPPGGLLPQHWQISAAVIVMAALAIFPLSPTNLANRAYRLSFMGTTCSTLYSLYALYGVNSHYMGNLERRIPDFILNLGNWADPITDFIGSWFGQLGNAHSRLHNQLVWAIGQGTFRTSHANNVLGTRRSSRVLQHPFFSHLSSLQIAPLPFPKKEEEGRVEYYSKTETYFNGLLHGSSLRE